jgi:hypothetical protein
LSGPLGLHSGLGALAVAVAEVSFRTGSGKKARGARAHFDHRIIQNGFSIYERLSAKRRPRGPGALYRVETRRPHRWGAKNKSAPRRSGRKKRAKSWKSADKSRRVLNCNNASRAVHM